MLTADKPYQVWANGQRHERTVTPRAQLRELLSEIVPPQFLNALATGQQFAFTYASAHGNFDVGVTHDLGALKITLVPHNAPALAPRANAPFAPPLITPPMSHALPLAPPLSPPQNVPNAPAPIVPAPQYPAPVYPPHSYPPPPSVQVQHVHHYHGAPVLGRSPRSRIVAGLLGLLLPGLGIHRFYLGYTGTGVCYLLMLFVFSWFTCGITAGLVGIIGFIEGIIILCGGMNDAEGRPLSA